MTATMTPCVDADFAGAPRPENTPPIADPDWATMPVTQLEDELTTLAAHLAAGEYRWLSMLAVFDERKGYRTWECRSAADWLVRRCGIGRSTAMEKVRVARAIRSLPVISATFARGELSYSMVRALTRVASPANEADLVRLARCAPASMIERLVGRYARVKSGIDGPTARERYVRFRWDDDGSLLLEGRFPPEEGAVVLQALAAGRDQLAADRRARRDAGTPPHEPPTGSADESPAEDGCQHAHESPAEDNPENAPESPAEDNDHVTAHDFLAGDRRDTAHESPAEDEDDDEDEAWGPRGRGYFDADRGVWIPDGDFDDLPTDPEPDSATTPAPGTPESLAGDRSPATVSPREDADGPAGGASNADAFLAMAHTLLSHAPVSASGDERYLVLVHVDVETLAGGDGLATLEPGQAIDPATARRLACDAAVIALVHGRDGTLIDIGRRSRTPTTAQRRLLRVRDGGCRFPGCEADRFLKSHHLVFWEHGGRTDLANLILLCSFHHDAIHRRGYTATGNANHTVEFRRPDGSILEDTPLPAVPTGDEALRAANQELPIDAGTAVPRWNGDHMDYGMAVDGLLHRDGLHDHGIYPFPTSTRVPVSRN